MRLKLRSDIAYTGTNRTQLETLLEGIREAEDKGFRLDNWKFSAVLLNEPTKEQQRAKDQEERLAKDQEEWNKINANPPFDVISTELRKTGKYYQYRALLSRREAQAPMRWIIKGPNNNNYYGIIPFPTWNQSRVVVSAKENGVISPGSYFSNFLQRGLPDDIKEDTMVEQVSA